MPENHVRTPFAPGAVVLVTLGAPREKFWGVLVDLNATGVTVCGIDLNSFDDFCAVIRSGEAASPTTVFFPLVRVERVELDVANGAIPSLCERFAEKCGCSAREFLSGQTEFDGERSAP